MSRSFFCFFRLLFLFDLIKSPDSRLLKEVRCRSIRSHRPSGPFNGLIRPIHLNCVKECEEVNLEMNLVSLPGRKHFPEERLTLIKFICVNTPIRRKEQKN